MVHLEQPHLSGLSRNPAAPVQVLVRLAAHPAGRHGLATRPGRLPDAVAEALLTHGGSRAAVSLHGPRVSAAMRRRIAEHPDPAIRTARADLLREWVELGLPMDIDDLVEVYGRPPERLAAAPDPKLRAAVARAWSDRPVPVHLALLTDPDPGVRAAAAGAQQPGVPAEYHERCLADPAVRALVAGRLPLTPDRFAELLATGDRTVLRAVAGNPHLTAGMAARLQDDPDPAVCVAVAYGRPVTPELRDRLLARVEAEKAAGSIEARVALDGSSYEPGWLRDAPLAERLTYLDCPHAVFRRVLAAGRDLPDEAWRRLDADPDLSVRIAAAHRPEAPPRVVLRLLRAHGEVSGTPPYLADHPNLPLQELRGFTDASDPRVRLLALKVPDLPVGQLRRLAGEEPSLRAAVARHPRTDAELLERLLADRDPEVADAAAANPVLPRARMEAVLAAAGV
ncbi:hypothetical protein [Streptomyces sp. NRRL B-24484]|uniref:variant leucine-rich repeat-containing protein n=1 Tax=Streptomyces sp. NRRL B-24484 TaxID=1463833 RepID=UPI001331A8ED|nr:hypothetical protein [Streptomyces sp. NRRL B-24484]